MKIQIIYKTLLTVAINVPWSDISSTVAVGGVDGENSGENSLTSCCKKYFKVVVYCLHTQVLSYKKNIELQFHILQFWNV